MITFSFSCRNSVNNRVWSNQSWKSSSFKSLSGFGICVTGKKDFPHLSSNSSKEQRRNFFLDQFFKSKEKRSKSLKVEFSNFGFIAKMMMIGAAGSRWRNKWVFPLLESEWVYVMWCVCSLYDIFIIINIFLGFLVGRVQTTNLIGLRLDLRDKFDRSKRESERKRKRSSS